MHILIIEDEPDIRNEMKTFLQNSLYQVSVLEQFSNIPKQVLQLSPDLILLDLNLPEQSGFSVCSEVRAISDIPVIFVTGRDSASDEVTALLTGGDDYITKPFQLPVLLAHIQAVLKRTARQAYPMMLTHKGVELDTAKGCIRYAGGRAELTKNELKILSFLFRKKGTIVSRPDLLEALWDDKAFLDDNSLSVHITRIRAKLDGLGVTDFIHTKRGMGYLI